HFLEEPEQFLVMIHETMLMHVIDVQRVELDDLGVITIGGIECQKIQDVGLGGVVSQYQQVGLAADEVATEPADGGLQGSMRAELGQRQTLEEPGDVQQDCKDELQKRTQGPAKRIVQVLQPQCDRLLLDRQRRVKGDRLEIGTAWFARFTHCLPPPTACNTDARSPSPCE